MVVAPELQGLRGLTEPTVVDTSEQKTSYLIICPNGAHLRLSASAYALVQAAAGGESFEATAARLSAERSQNMTAADVMAAYQRVAQQIVVAQRAYRAPRSLWLRLPFLPAALVNAIAQPLTTLFLPMVAIVCAVAVALTVLLVGYQIFDPSIRPDLASIFSLSTMLWGYLLVFISLVAHEMGHAAACARYGARPSKIGFGVYFIWPVLYADVTTAWQLTRRQRVIVDLGGSYFQLLVAALYALAYWFSGWAPLSIAIVLIVSGCLFSLNPILKFDGYFALSDALGVPNLDRQPGRILRYGWSRLRGHPCEPLPWPRLITLAMVAYTLATVAFWGYAMYWLVWLAWVAFGFVLNLVLGSLMVWYNSELEATVRLALYWLRYRRLPYS